MRFHDRVDAGQQLAARLTQYAGRSDVIVLGLPRGGVPVAHQVAMRLEVPLDVLLVRKLGVPGHPITQRYASRKSVSNAMRCLMSS